MKLTDEQYAQVAKLCGSAEAYAVKNGKLAVAAVAPLLLSEPSAEEMALTWNESASLPLDRRDWPSLMKVLLRRRLASVTAKPDPAVEAVASVMRDCRLFAGPASVVVTEVISKIVAAVDAARAK